MSNEHCSASIVTCLTRGGAVLVTPKPTIEGGDSSCRDDIEMALLCV